MRSRQFKSNDQSANGTTTRPSSAVCLRTPAVSLTRTWSEDKMSTPLITTTPSTEHPVDPPDSIPAASRMPRIRSNSHQLLGRPRSSIDDSVYSVLGARTMRDPAVNSTSLADDLSGSPMATEPSGRANAKNVRLASKRLTGRANTVDLAKGVSGGVSGGVAVRRDRSAWLNSAFDRQLCKLDGALALLRDEVADVDSRLSTGQRHSQTTGQLTAGHSADLLTVNPLTVRSLSPAALRPLVHLGGGRRRGTDGALPTGPKGRDEALGPGGDTVEREETSKRGRGNSGSGDPGRGCRRGVARRGRGDPGRRGRVGSSGPRAEEAELHFDVEMSHRTNCNPAQLHSNTRQRRSHEATRRQRNGPRWAPADTAAPLDPPRVVGSEAREPNCSDSVWFGETRISLPANSSIIRNKRQPLSSSSSSSSSSNSAGSDSATTECNGVLTLSHAHSISRHDDIVSPYRRRAAMTARHLKRKSRSRLVNEVLTIPAFRLETM